MKSKTNKGSLTSERRLTEKEKKEMNEERKRSDFRKNNTDNENLPKEDSDDQKDGIVKGPEKDYRGKGREETNEGQ